MLLFLQHMYAIPLADRLQVQILMVVSKVTAQKEEGYAREK